MTFCLKRALRLQPGGKAVVKAVGGKRQLWLWAAGLRGDSDGCSARCDDDGENAWR